VVTNPEMEKIWKTKKYEKIKKNSKKK